MLLDLEGLETSHVTRVCQVMRGIQTVLSCNRDLSRPRLIFFRMQVLEPALRGWGRPGVVRQLIESLVVSFGIGVSIRYRNPITGHACQTHIGNSLFVYLRT